MKFVLLWFYFCSAIVFANVDLQAFDDPEQEARYHQLVAKLRCPMCLNTNLDGSDAPIAQDLRKQVHRLLLEGYSDAQILDFMRARYGDFILYEPRLTAATLLLWFGPLLMLVAGIWLLWYRFRVMPKKSAPDNLTAAQRVQLEAVLSKTDQTEEP